MTDNIVNGHAWSNQLPLEVRTFFYNGRYNMATVRAQVASDGTFSFTASANTSYRLFITESSLPVSYPYYGPFEPINAKTTGAHIGPGVGSELEAGGYITINVADQPITDINFGVDRYPTIGSNITVARQPNPLGTSRVQVPTLTSADPEDGLSANGVRIYLYNPDHYTDPFNRDFGYGPGYSTLYYDGIPILDKQTILSYDPSKLTVDPTDGNVTTRFNYSSVDAAGVESKNQAVVTIPFSDTVSQIDFGDAPNTYRVALDYSNGPRHTILDNLKLGSLIDAEASGQAGPNGLDYTATGDDVNGIDDEDGLTSFVSLSKSNTIYSLSIAITNTTGMDATLSGWIDFNHDETFSNNERAQVIVLTGTTSAILSWTVLSGYVVGQTFARFRIATIASEVAQPYGAANSGEVEDYLITPAAPLPVEFVVYDGKWVEGAGNQLTWITSWEKGTSHFLIERSSDAISFEAVGRVAALGNSSTNQRYSFVDKGPSSGLWYYRLKQVDLDGTYTHSQIIAVRIGNESLESLTISPNPSSGPMLLEYKKGIKSVGIHSLTGALIEQHEFTQAVDRWSWVSTGQPAGVYVIQVKTQDGKSSSLRWVKQ
ncbi:T9SS type A sorting domain-containing protein [Spirosoma sp. BT704]|uniref:T9SS type A sorting domain-containing protein n=2 Tax=Spirosoma validum TaxID=2771355 RepID=A0A927B8F0_9BACT|nr:T9SS type A sorting domain-containing protein [Spirosoma validum]